jgi:hypothetical protein
MSTVNTNSTVGFEQALTRNSTPVRTQKGEELYLVKSEECLKMNLYLHGRKYKSGLKITVLPSSMSIKTAIKQLCRSYEEGVKLEPNGMRALVNPDKTEVVLTDMSLRGGAGDYMAITVAVGATAANCAVPGSGMIAGAIISTMISSSRSGPDLGKILSDIFARTVTAMERIVDRALTKERLNELNASFIGAGKNLDRWHRERDPKYLDEALRQVEHVLNYIETGAIPYLASEELIVLASTMQVVIAWDRMEIYGVDTSVEIIRVVDTAVRLVRSGYRIHSRRIEELVRPVIINVRRDRFPFRFTYSYWYKGRKYNEDESRPHVERLRTLRVKNETRKVRKEKWNMAVETVNKLIEIKENLTGKPQKYITLAG